MGKIGNLGRQIVFETSDRKILTFHGLSQKVSGRWSNHDIMKIKPKSEFHGPGLRTISFQIDLDVNFGIRPREILERMEYMIEKGRVETLVIGGKKIGKEKWKMTSMSETWDCIYSNGELARATCNITLEEYF